MLNTTCSALEEDCATALEKFQGYLLDGREISLDYFTKRVIEGKEKTKPVSSNTEVSNEKEVTGDELPENNTEDKADGSHIRHSRQILVYGVPIDVNKKIFKSVLSKHAKNVIVELIKQVTENSFGVLLLILKYQSRIVNSQNSHKSFILLGRSFC